MKSSQIIRVALGAFAMAGALRAQQTPPEKDYLDKMLERRPFTPAETATLNRDGAANPNIDVRDLVIFLNGLSVSATFGSAESIAFHSQGSITLPIYFSKPVTGTIKFDLGGDAGAGVGQDYTLIPSQVTVTNAISTQVTVLFQPWRGVGGEKVVRLTLNRNPAVIPANGNFATHLVRIRQFEQGEFVGMLTFPSGSGLPSLPVRIGLGTGGSAVCSFQSESTLLGSQLPLTWTAGFAGFPAFTGSVALTIPGASLGRSAPVNASLAIQRMAAPYGAELDAYLSGFPLDDQPALYQATFTFHDLIAAGQGRAVGSNPFAVVHQGRLTLQPVAYAAANP